MASMEMRPNPIRTWQNRTSDRSAAGALIPQYAGVAQLAVQGPCNAQVVGSSPITSSVSRESLHVAILFLLISQINRGCLCVAYIYKITNILNNKVYIGKTEKTIKERFVEHCHDCQKESQADRPLYKAMKKYGIDKFVVEVVEETTTELACEREQYWISFYNSYACGYNATIGGDGKPYVDRDKVLDLYSKLQNITDTAKECSVSIDTVKSILVANNITIMKSSQINKDRLGKPVAMYGLDGTFIKAFSDCADAARYLIQNNLTACKFTTIRTHISEAARGKRRVAAKYVWKFV